MIDLNSHFSLETTKDINRITTPLKKHFGITHFRYLKLYPNKSRVLLTNHAEALKFIYETGNYKNMWFDGEFPEHLFPGWHTWHESLAALKSAFEIDINHELNLSNGLTFIKGGNPCWEIYTFDSNSAAIHHLDKAVLQHFIHYFKTRASKLLISATHEKIVLPEHQLLQHPQPMVDTEVLSAFYQDTPVKNYYLGPPYEDVYLTAKEVHMLYWLTQGKTLAEIAMIVNKSVRTVEDHVINVRQKLGCYKQTQIVKIIIEAGILDAFQQQMRAS